MDGMTGNRHLTGRLQEQLHFRNLLTRDCGQLWLIEGPGGIGKSALLTRLACICSEQKRSYLRLDVRDGLASEGEAVLRQLCQGGVGMERLRSLADGDVWPWLNRGEAAAGHAGKLWDSLKDVLFDQLKPDDKQSVGLLAQLLKMFAGVVFAEQKQLGRELQASLKAQPERTLLESMGHQGDAHPVLLIDTFEKLLTSGAQVNSRLDLDLGQSGQIAPLPIQQTQHAEEFLASLIRILTGRGWIIVIAGRRLSALVRAQTQDVQQLPGLSETVIAQEWLAPMLQRRTVSVDAGIMSALAHQLHVRSFGGSPLWLNALCSIVAQLLNQGVAPSALAKHPQLQEQMEQAPLGGAVNKASAVRSKADILQVLFRGERLDMSRAWRLALPLRLDRSRLLALFPQADEGDGFLRRLQDMGLFTGSSQGTSLQLHEEVRDLLLWWAQAKSLLQTEATRQDYAALLKAVCSERPDLADLSDLEVVQGQSTQSKIMLTSKRFTTPADMVWCQEAVRYACLASERLARPECPATPQNFLAALSGSPSLGGGEKWWGAVMHETLSDDQISALMEMLIHEEKAWSDEFGPLVAERLIRDHRLGLVQGVDDFAWWLQCIEQVDHWPGAYYGLFDAPTSEALRTQGLDASRTLTLKNSMLQHAAAKGWINEVQVAKALLAIAIHLGEIGEFDAEIEVYDEVVSRFGSFEIPALQKQVVKALFNKAVTLRQLGKPEAEIEGYDDVIRRFGSSKLGTQQEEVAKALVNKGVALGQLGKPEFANEVYDEVVRRYGSSALPTLQERVAKALVNKGITLSQLGDLETAIYVYDEVIRRFGSSELPELQEQVAKALAFKGTVLRQLGKQEAEIESYDEVVRRFGSSKLPTLQERVANALGSKRITLGQLGKPELEMQVCDEVVRRFGESGHLPLRYSVARALNGKGFALLIVGKAEAEKVNPKSRWSQAVELFEQALPICNQDDRAMILGNQAYACWLLGEQGLGSARMMDALVLGGEPLYLATLNDLAIHALPQDKFNAELLVNCWAAVKAQSNAE